MMQRKLSYAVMSFCLAFMLKEIKAKPGPTDSGSVLQCVNKNATAANHLLCCNDLSSNHGDCVLFSHNGNEIDAVINGKTIPINTTESTCAAGSSYEVCLNVKTVDNKQLCFSLSCTNGYKSNTVCASLPELHVNGSSAVNRRDLASSLGFLSILSSLGGSSGGLGQVLGVLSIVNSLPFLSNLDLSNLDLSQLSSLTDLSNLPGLSSLPDLGNLTDSLGGLSSVLSILSILSGSS